MRSPTTWRSIRTYIAHPASSDVPNRKGCQPESPRLLSASHVVKCRASISENAGFITVLARLIPK